MVACPDSGEGWVIFSQFDGTAESIWFARYVPGAGWKMTLEFDETRDPCSEPLVAAQGLGGCVVWFRQTDEMVQLMARILD